MSSSLGQIREDIFVFKCACGTFIQGKDKKGSIQFGPGKTERWFDGSEHTLRPVLHQGEKLGWIPFNTLGSYLFCFSYKEGEKPNWGGYKWFKLSESDMNPAEAAHKCASKGIVWSIEEMKSLSRPH